jgi:HEAT repeat protein
MADESLLRSGLNDAAPTVRVTATVGLVAGGWMALEDAEGELDAFAPDAEPETLVAFANAVRALPSLAFKPALRKLAAVEDENVQLAAIRAIKALGDPEFVPMLTSLLARRALRMEVRDTLVALGPAAFTAVGTALADTSSPHAVRRHLPQVIAAFGTPQASTVLLRRLLEESDGMVRFKILRALGRMRAVNDKLPLDGKVLRQAIEQNIDSAFRFMRWKHACSAQTPNLPAAVAEYHQMLIELLADKQAHTLERLFRLLNLLANDEEFLRVYRGFQSARREARSGSRELVEYLVEPHIRRTILALVDDLEVGGGALAADAGERPTSFEQTLEELVESRIESLSSLAAYEIGALRMTRLQRSVSRVGALSDSHASLLKDALDTIGPEAAAEAARG